MTGKGLLIVLIGALTIATPAAHGQHFESDSKRLGGSKMDIVVREIERRDRSS
jgi:2-keto-4-pentenoate hydratase